jgi:hypothetical protein
MAGAGSADRERRPGDRCQASIVVTVEARNAVDRRGVVVDVDVPDDVRSVRAGRGRAWRGRAWRAGGRSRRTTRGCDRDDDREHE